MLVDAAVGGGGLVPAAKTGSDAVTDQVSDWISGNGEAVLRGGSALSKHVMDKREEFAGCGGSAGATTDWGLLLDEPSVDFSDPEMAELAGIIVRNGTESRRKELREFNLQAIRCFFPLQLMVYLNFVFT